MILKINELEIELICLICSKLHHVSSSHIPVLRGFTSWRVIYLSDVNIANSPEKDFAIAKNIFSVAESLSYTDLCKKKRQPL